MRLRVWVRTLEAIERIKMRGGTCRVADKMGMKHSYLSDLVYRRRAVGPDVMQRLLENLTWRGRKWDDLFETEQYTTTS